MKPIDWVCRGVFLILLSGKVGAAVAHTVQLNAQKIAYHASENVLEATHDVQLTLGRYQVSGQYIRYDQRKKNLVASGNTELKAPSQSYSLDRFFFDLETQQLEGDHLTGVLNGIYFKAQSFSYRNKALELKKVRFSTCSKSTPDYHIEADWMVYYNHTGLIWSVNNWVRWGNTPLFWMPTLVGGIGPMRSISESMPVPQLASDQYAGTSIRHAVNYLLNAHVKGSVTLGYSQYLGGMIGLHNDYVAPDYQVNTTLSASSGGGLDYGILWQFPLGAPRRSPQLLEGIEQHITPRPDPIIIGIGSYYRRLLNYSRVSQAWVLGIDSPPSTWWPLSVQLELSPIKEEDMLSSFHYQSQRLMGAAQWEHDIPLWQEWVGVMGSTLDLRYYDQGLHWKRWYGILGIKYQSPNWQGHVRYSQDLLHDPQRSPFEFERRFAQQESEIGMGWHTTTHGIKIGIDGNWALQSKQWRRLDYQVGSVFHCVGLSLVYQSIQQQWGIGFELVNTHDDRPSESH